mgnify:CR=1 FL=1
MSFMECKGCGGIPGVTGCYCTRQPADDTLTHEQITAGAAVLGDDGKPIGRNTAPAVALAALGLPCAFVGRPWTGEDKVAYVDTDNVAGSRLAGLYPATDLPCYPLGPSPHARSTFRGGSTCADSGRSFSSRFNASARIAASSAFSASRTHSTAWFCSPALCA